MEYLDLIPENYNFFFLVAVVLVLLLLYLISNDVYETTVAVYAEISNLLISFRNLWNKLKAAYRHLFTRQKYSIEVEIIKAWEEQLSYPPEIPFLFIDPDTGRFKCDFYSFNHVKNMVSWRKIDEKKISNTEVPRDIFLSCKEILGANNTHKIKLYYEKFAWQKKTTLFSIE